MYSPAQKVQYERVKEQMFGKSEEKIKKSKSVGPLSHEKINIELDGTGGTKQDKVIKETPSQADLLPTERIEPEELEEGRGTPAPIISSIQHKPGSS